MSQIIDLITKFKSERPEAKLGQQLFAIPKKDNEMIEGQDFYYYVGDRRRTAVNFKNEVCLNLRYLKFKKISPSKYRKLQDSMTPLEDLISYDYIYPFLVFVNGHMIRWENITVIITQERYSLLIHDLDQDFFDANLKGTLTSYGIIMLPDSIVYKDGDFPITNKTLFAFDEDGLIATSGTTRTVIENFDDKLSNICINPTDSPIFFFSDQNQYSYFSENICVFNNGLYDPTNEISVLSSACKVNGGDLGASDNLHVKIFFNKDDGTPSYNNISRVKLDAIRDDVYNALETGNIPQYLDILKIPFDITMDRDLDYETNRYNAINTIAKYNPLFFNEYYVTQKNFATYEVDYNWITSHTNDDGDLQIPRRLEDGVDYFIILLVNGELYKYYQNHHYETSWFICPIAGMKQGDIIELWYFKNAKNWELPATISQEQPYLPLDIENIYINDNMRIFCNKAHKTPYNFPTNGIQQFPVEYHFEYDENEKRFRVRFENNFYYGKEVTLTSCNRFKYYGFNIHLDEGQTNADFFKINLGTRFNFCNEYDRFLVFYNGRRLMNDNFRLILPNRPTTPFNTCEIYLTIPLYNNDRFDIFYLPHHFDDIYSSTEELNATGLITIEKELLPFALDKHLFTFWINGKKIPNSAIMNFDSNKVQLISDQSTLKNLRVTTMITDKSEYDELKNVFQAYTSYWDMVIGEFSNPYELLGIPDTVLTNTENDFFAESVDTDAIMRELIRDQYVSNLAVDITGPFEYDYDDISSSSIGVDSGGNILFDICDSNTENNFDVERPEV